MVGRATESRPKDSTLKNIFVLNFMVLAAHTARHALAFRFPWAAVWCCFSCRRRFGVAPPAGHALVLHIGRTPGVLYIGGAYVVLHIEETTGWCGGVSGELLVGAEYRGD